MPSPRQPDVTEARIPGAAERVALVAGAVARIGLAICLLAIGAAYLIVLVGVLLALT